MHTGHFSPLTHACIIDRYSKVMLEHQVATRVRNRFGARRYEAAAVPLDIPKMLDEGYQFGRCGKPLVKENLITRLRRMQHTSWRSYARCKMRGLASCFFNTAAVRCSKVTDEAYL